jgi:hypothetical protein
MKIVLRELNLSSGLILKQSTTLREPHTFTISSTMCPAKTASQSFCRELLYLGAY